MGVLFFGGGGGYARAYKVEYEVEYEYGEGITDPPKLFWTAANLFDMTKMYILYSNEYDERRPSL